MYQKIEHNMSDKELVKKIIDKYNYKRQIMDAQIPLDGKRIEKFNNYNRGLRVLNNIPETYPTGDYWTPYKNFVSLERELLMRK